MINWVVCKVTEFAYEVRVPRLVVATITTYRGGWEVRFVNRPELDFEWDSFDVCLGYVRGIERIENLKQRKHRKKSTAA
jgi:hypothetical protein